MASPSYADVFRDRFNDPKKRAELEEEMRREQVESSLAQTADVNPDQAARDNALANQFDVDPGFVEQHRPDYEAAAQREDMNLEQVAKDAPITHERLGDPAFAQLASDDVGVLATIEGMGRETVQSFQRGVVNTKRSLLGGREAFGEAIGLGTGDRYFYDMYQYDQQLAELNVDYGAPESGAAGQLTNLASFTAEMAPLVSGGMVASGLGYAAAGLLTAAGVAVSAPAVGGLAGALYIYSTMTGEVYTGLESIEVGEDQEINRQAGAWVSMAAAVPMAALERIGIAKLPFFKRMVGAADESATTAFLREASKNSNFQQFVLQRAAGKALVGGTVEAGTEIGQKTIEMTATESFAQFQDGTYKDVRYTPTNALGRPLIDPETGEPLVIYDVAGVLAQLIDAGEAGFYGGGGMAIGGAAINVATESQAADKLRAKVGMLEQASASRLRERDKPTFQKHIRDLIAKGSAPEYIYVDRTKANELAQDESEEDGSPNEEWQSLTENVPSLAGADQASEETGAEIAIPYDEWVTYVAGTSAGDSLAMDSRESLEDFTPRQLQEQADKTAEEAARFSEEEFAELTDDDAVLEAIEQKIEAGILQEPRLGQVEAKRYAQFIAGRVRVRAERNNQTVRELVAESGIVQVIPSRQLEAGPEGPVALRASLESLIARAEQKGRLQRYRREDGVRPNIRERRMLRALAEEGGVEPNSDMGQILRSLDVPETGSGSIRGLYQEGGLSNVDQLVPSEFASRGRTRLSDILGDPSLQGEDGFVDPNKVFEAIAQENRGDPFMSGDESIAFGEEQQEFERVQAALEEAGLTLDDDTEALLDLLSPLDDEMSLERDGDGEFYQGSLLPPGLKSVLLEVATTLPKKGTAAEYRAALEKQAQKGNIKNDELQFSGLLEFLEMSEGLEDGMSRRDIVEFLQEGGLRVRVNLLGGEASETTVVASQYASQLSISLEPYQLTGSYSVTDGTSIRLSPDLGLQLEDLPESPLVEQARTLYTDSLQYEQSIDEEVFSSYVGDAADIQATLTTLLRDNNLNQPLEESGFAEPFRSRFVAKHPPSELYPNGRSYIDPGMARDPDELLILMMLSRRNFADEYFAALDASVVNGPGGTQLEGSPLFGEYITEADTGYMEILVTIPRHKEETREGFTAGHWGSEPSDVVVSLLAEVRDEKLFIFEIQSDWHQRGRKKGYLTAETAKELDAARLKSSDAHSVRSREMARVKADIRAKFLAAGLSTELDDDLATLDALAAAGGTIKVPIDDKKIAVIVEMRDGFGAHIEFLNADGSPRGMGVEKLPFDFRNAHRAVTGAVNELTNRDQDVMSASMLYKSAEDEVAKLRDKVPEAPFSKTESWTDLGLKNALLQAHAMGLSGVVMTDAQMIDDRWGDEGVTNYYKTTVPKRMEKLAKKYGGEIEPLEEWDGIGAQGAINFTPELIDAIESDSIELFQTIATDFAGIGTVDAMLPQHQSVHAAEIQPDIVAAFNEANGTEYEARDVLQVDPSEIEDADLYHASPVCTNLSAARKGRGVSEIDESSARKIAANILGARPPAVTIENVPLYADTVLLKIITDVLDEEGYTYDVDTYDAADYGAAQTRKRMILRAVREGELPPLPATSEPGDWFSVVSDLVDGAEDSTIPNWERTRIDAMIERGELDASLPIITMGGSTDKRRASARNAGGPSPTLTATPKSVPRIIMPDGTVKRLSPRMMARLMGLPDDFVIPEDNWALSKTVMGNGVHGAVTTQIIGPVADLGSEIAQRGQMELFQSGASEKVAATPGIQNVLKYLNPDEARKLKANTAQRLIDLIDELPEPGELASVAFAGRAKRGWYLESAKAILDVFGLEDSRRFTGLLAATSPQTSVESNLVNTLAVWNAWVSAGRPVDKAQILALMGESVQGDKGEESVLPAWRNNSYRILIAENPTTVILSGPKVNSFMLNLRGVVDEVTNDTWMANIMGVQQTMFAGSITKTDPGKGPGYMAANVVTRRAAEILSKRTGLDWTPAEIQETIWSWARTLGQLGEVKGETRSLIQILTDGELTDERIADTPDFAILFSQGVYRTLLKEGGYEEELQGLERAARDNRPDGAGARGEAGQAPGVTEGRYRGDLRRAARRLERTRQERRESKGELGQPEEFADGRRGAMGPVDELERGELGNAYIRLLGASNRSTFLHEASHLFLFELLADSAREGAPQQLRDDVAILRQALGMTPDQAFSTEQHELFASMAEAYFFEGNAPTRELQPMFDQFREWMLRIYRSVQRIFGYDVPLSDEVRGVLDRMLATDQEIAFARAQRGMDQVLRDSDQNMLGLTDDEREEYVEIERKGRRAQTESIEKAARAVEKRRQSEKYRARKAALREEVEQEVNARPAMRLRMWLQHGKLPDGTEPNVPPGKMDRNALRNIAGNGILKVLPSGRYGYWTRSGGVHPDVLRVEFGFETVNQMLEQLALMVKEHPQDIINRETEKQMLEQYGEYSTEEQIDSAVAKAIDQKDAIDQLVFEERMMAKRSGGQVSPTQMLRQIARRIVSSTRLPELKPGRFSKQAERAAMRALEALQSGDLAAAQEAKRQQRLAILMESEARKALDQVERHLRHVAKLKTKAGRERVAVPGTKHGNALGYLLDKFDFRRSVGNRPPTGDAEGAAALIEFINEETALGYEPLVSPAQAIETGRRHYRSLTYDEFMEVIEGIRSIEASARRENKIHLRDKAQDREAVALELRQRSQETRHIKRPKMIDKELPAEERTRAMQAIYFATRSINSIIYQLDGGPVGPWRNYLWEPIVQAVNKREEMSEAYLSELSELLKQHVGDRDAEYRERKFNVYGMEASRYGLISMALNLGTESNTSKLIEGYQGQGLAWSEGKIKAYLDQNLSREDWQLVQSLWDLTNKLWPTISADAVATYGIEPEKVEGRTLSTPYGEVTGQYFPVVYDPDKLDSVHRTQDKGVWEGSETSFRRPLTDSGYRVSRTGFRGPILLDLEVLPRHLDKVIHDLALHNVLNEVDRLIDSEHVKAAIKEAHGLEAFRLFRPWLMAIAKDAVDPNPPTATALEWLARESRTGLSVFYLAWNTTTVMMQTLGHFNTHAMLIQNMGINNARKYHGLGVRTVLGSPKESRNRAFEMSGVMRRRVAAGERDRKDALRRLSGKGGREADATMFGLKVIGLMQTYAVDLPSWWAAFYAAKDGALSADTGPMTDIQAVAAADAIVNLTQGGGDVQDLAAVMRGNNVNRMFTAFHSYMMTLFSHLSLIASQGGVGGRQKKDVNRSRAMAAYFLVMVLSPTLERFLRDFGDDDDEEEDKNPIRTVAANHLAQYPGFIPGVSSQKNLIANLIDDGDRFIGGSTSIERMIEIVVGPLEKALEMLSGEEETTAEDLIRATLIARTLLLKKGVTNGMLKIYDAAYELIAGEDE